MTDPTARQMILPRPTVASVLRLLLSLAIALALLGWVLPRVTETTWGDMVGVLRTVPATALAACFVFTMAFLISYAITMRASLPGLTIPKALTVNTAGSAVSKLLPGGGAVGLAATFFICRSWGFSAGAVATSAIVTGVWNTLSRVALPILAIGFLALARPELPAVLRQAAWGAGVSGALILALFLGIIVSAHVADSVGRAVDRLGGWVFPRAHRAGRAQAAMSDARAQIIERVREAWHWLTLGMVGFFAAQLAIFLIALHVTGIQLAFTPSFAAFAIGRLLAGVGITPGGIGITEMGTAAALVALGADPALSAAAVVLVSIFTNLIELPLGVLAWGLWSLDPQKQTFQAERATHAEPTGRPV
ncbi:lysylphosphatidylglycerol synthase transmembrane domain-containing protein [Knoellia aerolata]|nr:lysylphosphatidylglycerol synthase transmembrane domain-containing protein [Knoellia aerolata]